MKRRFWRLGIHLGVLRRRARAEPLLQRGTGGFAAERAERVARVERAERVERVERVKRVERVERAERVARSTMDPASRTCVIGYIDPATERAERDGCEVLPVSTPSHPGQLEAVADAAEGGWRRCGS